MFPDVLSKYVGLRAESEVAWPWSQGAKALLDFTVYSSGTVCTLATVDAICL
jgi:hypothetical protein